MFSGVKFISPDSLDSAWGEDNDGVDSVTKRKISHSKRDKHRTRKRSSRRSGSSDDDLQRIEKRSQRGNKWYSSDEYSSSEEGSTDSPSDRKKKKTRKSNNNMDGVEDGGQELKHKSERRRKNQPYPKQEYSSPSPSTSEDADVSAQGKHTACKGNAENIDIARKQMGLEWMLRPSETTDKNPAVIVPELPEEPQADEQTPKVNPRELNPYLKNNGTGYPVDTEEKTADENKLASSPVVGDGGASWRLKALKRAKEQAAREGRKLEEVVGERWGSVGELAVSASYSAAPARAHLHEIKNRKRGVAQESETSLDGENKKNHNQNAGRSYSKDVSVPRPGMRAPKVRDSLSWARRKGEILSASDDSIIAAAASSLNKFSDDGSFMSGFVNQQNISSGEAGGSSGGHGRISDSKVIPCTENTISYASTPVEQQMSVNQLAAKALQLRLKGKHEEAEKLMQEAANAKAKHAAGETSSRERMVGRSRQVIQNVSMRKMEDDADRNLAQTIVQNRKYSSASQADDEYDYELAPSKKSLKKSAASAHKASDRGSNPQRFLTQPERCIFCFENPNRPKHLVVSIANFTYLMLPQRQSVVPGHCCILPLQHESATRSVDNNVWQEIRNFKKCLIMMFAQQEKEVVFLETVVDLAKQRRHCLVECIPMPREIAKEAPLYFKKAIDEAEDEWSQHNAKKLIDTSEKGLRGSIPKDFPYFHVEFGLNKGFVHVIDDETQFNSSLGLNVIRGMLRLPEEDMYRSRRRESVETQKQAATDFLRDWEPFDWTKQLE